MVKSKIKPLLAWILEFRLMIPLRIWSADNDRYEWRRNRIPDRWEYDQGSVINYGEPGYETAPYEIGFINTGHVFIKNKVIAMSTLPDAKPCSKCGGEGHLVCRQNIYTLVGELYTVDCEDCSNSTDEEHAEPENAIKQWNTQPPPLSL